MRHARMLLFGLVATLLTIWGCKQQPELKPPDHPEVLNAPGERDKRYAEPFNYPRYVLSDDPGKQAVEGQSLAPTKSAAKMPGMGGGGGPGGMSRGY